MKSQSKNCLAVALYGMDGRTHKTMLMFLKGPCNGIAQVVDEKEAIIDIIDADAMHAKVFLEHCLVRTPLRPIIVLSLETLNIDNTIYLQKPVKAAAMLAAFKVANDIINKKHTVATKKIAPEKQQEAVKEIVKPAVVVRKEKVHKVEELSADKKVYTNDLERKKMHKHEAAMMIDEQHFSSFIGIVSEVDFDDPEQWPLASYDPKQYYQGYVQTAVRAAFTKGQVLRLNSGWKSLIILPHSFEVWLNADDKQLRFFAGVAVSTSTEKLNSMSLAPVDPKKDIFADELDKFHEVNAFLWKLACWTSKGRYPNIFDLSTPVYLKQWPNFTRLMITPHAMRITALLIMEPRSIQSLIEVLKIKPQYIFIFISAAYATGILGVAKRQVDEIVEAPATKSNKKKGVFGRILNKLRG